jgi:hypothetical protein
MISLLTFPNRADHSAIDAETFASEVVAAGVKRFTRKSEMRQIVISITSSVCAVVA